MRNKLLLFPYGGNSREALLSLLALNRVKKVWDVIGFIDDDPAYHGTSCLGVKVLGGREVLKKFTGAKVLAVPGSPRNFLQRKEVIESLKLERSRFATILDPSAVVSPDAKVGSNVLVMPNVVISCGVTVGSNCVILPNTTILHDSVIGDYSCIGSGVSISGSVVIGPLCYIGSGVRIKEHVVIKKGALVGLGANVISDIEEGVVAVGNPAHVIRKVAQ